MKKGSDKRILGVGSPRSREVPGRAPPRVCRTQIRNESAAIFKGLVQRARAVATWTHGCQRFLPVEAVDASQTTFTKSCLLQAGCFYHPVQPSGHQFFWAKREATQASILYPTAYFTALGCSVFLKYLQQNFWGINLSSYLMTLCPTNLGAGSFLSVRHGEVWQRLSLCPHGLFLSVFSQDPSSRSACRGLVPFLLVNQPV